MRKTGTPNIHSLSGVDLLLKTAICSNCGSVKIKVRKSGKLACMNRVKAESRRHRLTPSARRRKQRNEGRGYRIFVKTSCERCGFIPQHIRQMDVHHKDRNNKNNDPSNLETLCANCHRLEHATKMGFPSLG